MGGVNRSNAPRRGEVWEVDLAPSSGHEQGGRRPALVISRDVFNAGPSRLVVLLPITSRDRDIPTHIRITPPEGGLTRPSVALCDQVRTVSHDRLRRRRGMVGPATLTAVADVLRRLLVL